MLHKKSSKVLDIFILIYSIWIHKFYHILCYTMETIDKKTYEEPKKSSSLKEWTTENLAEVFKSERARLQKGLRDLFANECYKSMFSRDFGPFEFTELDYFFDPELKEFFWEDEKNIDDWAPFIAGKFLNSYKYPNWKLHKLKLKLTEDEVVDIINQFAENLCKSRDQKIAEGSRNKYVKYRWLLYWAEKKWNTEAQHRLDAMELE